MGSLLITIGSFWPKVYGGPSQSVFFLTKSIHDLGYKTLVISFLEKKDNTQTNFFWLKNKSVKTIEDGLKIISLPRSLIGLMIYYKILLSDKFLKKKTIYMNSMFFYPTIFSLFYFVFFTSNKLIIAPRGELDPAALEKSLLIKKIILKIFKFLLIIRKDVIFHATSKREEQQIKRIFKKINVKLIENIFLPNYFKTNKQNNINKKKFEQKYFLVLTRIDRKKSIEILLEAYKNLSRSVQREYSLYIAGDGKDQNYKNQLIKFINNNNLNNRIKFLGFLNFEEKVVYLKNATMLLFPSKGENFGNVVLEAWSCYCPVVISNKTPWNLNVNDCTGTVVENTSEGFFNGINQIIEKKKKAKSLYKTIEFDKKLKTFEDKSSLKNYISMFFGV